LPLKKGARKIPKSSFRDEKRKVKTLHEACALDPWFFITEFCKTIDSHDPGAPEKMFPAYRYLEKLTRFWQQESKVAVVKSRQIMISWWGCALALWCVMHQRGSLVFLVSEKEEKADELVERAWIMYENLPVPWKLDYPGKRKYCSLQIPRMRSKIMGLPAGSNQVRSYTASFVFLDEFAFQDNQRKTLTGTLPSIRGGGKIAVVSTPNGHNPFEEIVLDKRIGAEFREPLRWEEVA